MDEIFIQIFTKITIKGYKINVRVEPVPAKREYRRWEAVFGKSRSFIFCNLKIEQKALLSLDVLLQGYCLDRQLSKIYLYCKLNFSKKRLKQYFSIVFQYIQVLCALSKAVVITVMDMVSIMVMVIKVMISINGAIIINMLRSRVPACVLDSGKKKASINFTRLSCKILSLSSFLLHHFARNLNQTQLVCMKDFYILGLILNHVTNYFKQKLQEICFCEICLQTIFPGNLFKIIFFQASKFKSRGYPTG